MELCLDDIEKLDDISFRYKRHLVIIKKLKDMCAIYSKPGLEADVDIGNTTDLEDIEVWEKLIHHEFTNQLNDLIKPKLVHGIKL